MPSKKTRKLQADLEQVAIDEAQLVVDEAQVVHDLANPVRESQKPPSPQLTSSAQAVAQGDQVLFTLSPGQRDPVPQLAIFDSRNNPVVANVSLIESDASNNVWSWDTSSVSFGTYKATVSNLDSSPSASPSALVMVQPAGFSGREPVSVTLQRSAETPTSDAALWVVIRQSTNALSFPNYVNFVDSIMCCPANLSNCPPTQAQSNGQVNVKDPCALPPLSARRFLPFPNMDAYRVLKVATECFLMMRCGVYLSPQALKDHLNNTTAPDNPTTYDASDDASRLNLSAGDLPNCITKWWGQYLQPADTSDPNVLILPYLALVRARLPELALTKQGWGLSCYGILQRKLTHPCLIELIWSYWMEEGMLVQALNAISRRFQNLRGNGDPLMRLDLDPLRSLNSLFWGYVQDEQHRLSVVRRAYEYNHEYGLALEGKAVRALRPSDSRSKFLEAFHNLLYLCSIFYKEDDDTTVVADGFPILNALKEIHYILAAGASNQIGDLPPTARQEMLMQQWLLARPEMRDFLGGKIMVPYPEDWMDRVDSVKHMEGWTDVSVIYFRDLAVYGEQIVLSIRYGAWSVTNNPAQAANWARYWRPEVQAYIHAYRAATGVDLTMEPVNSTLPSVLLLKRLATQRPALTR